jgi:hypothetical protein
MWIKNRGKLRNYSVIGIEFEQRLKFGDSTPVEVCLEVFSGKFEDLCSHGTRAVYKVTAHVLGIQTELIEVSIISE